MGLLIFVIVKNDHDCAFVVEPEVCIDAVPWDEMDKPARLQCCIRFTEFDKGLNKIIHIILRYAPSSCSEEILFISSPSARNVLSLGRVTFIGTGCKKQFSPIIDLRDAPGGEKKRHSHFKLPDIIVLGIQEPVYVMIVGKGYNIHGIRIGEIL